jgi:lipid II:glycine glycyltransferase (peptidoglycan interpeptide bridge formation enzyme)
MATGTSQLITNGVRSVPGTLANLTVRTITRAEHEQFVMSRSSVSFLQVPGWALVKPQWGSESIGWIAADGRMVGAALVLYRRVPRLGRSLAYLPEGPAIDWGSPDLAGWLRPMVEHLRARGAFTVRMGPPVERRWWEAATLRSALSAPEVKVLGDVTPDGISLPAASAADQLRRLGWRPADGVSQDGSESQEGPGAEDGGSPGGESHAGGGSRRRGGQGRGFAAGQPQYVFQVPIGGRSLPELFASLAPQWRRNIRTAERLGVEVTEGGPEHLDEFHDLYLVTAARDGFTPRPRDYFPRMWRGLSSEPANPKSSQPGSSQPGSWQPGSSGSGSPEPLRDTLPAGPADIRLYRARHRDTTLAAAIMIQVGEHVWYSYGASADHDRRLKPSNAMQWRMLSDAVGRGARVYDLRGIGSTLDPEHPLFGLTRFKLGSGGRAVEYLGEWELPLNRVLHRAVGAYLARR